MEDKELVKIMYAVLCIEEVHTNEYNETYNSIFKSPTDYVRMARELVRVEDTAKDMCFAELSTQHLAMLLMRYIKDEKLKYRDIHSASSYELTNNIYQQTNKEESNG